jgi:signal transduction histidine kinase/DNA-binding LacI/PurR family transcriptional regulator
MDYYWKRTQPKKKRFTIGFLDENTRDEYHGLLMAGVFEAARKYDMNVIRFGHFSLRIAETPKEDQIDRIYEHIHQYELDGLLFLGWIQVVNTNFEKFKRHFGTIPTLSIGTWFADIPSIYFPGDIYIRRILLHLINDHQRQKIVFIESLRSDGRLNVFTETMNEYGMYDPSRIIGHNELAGLDYGDRGRKAVRILLDERKVSFDAIVSLSNEETIAIIQELQSRKLNVPENISVTSYEDGEIGKLSTPSFTTIYYPWKELGFFGCKKMYELLTSGHTPLSTEEPGRIIIRDSCGCLPGSVSRARAGKIEPAGNSLATITEWELEELNQELQNRINCIDLRMPDLLNAFIKDFQAGSQQFFSAELERQLQEFSSYQRFSDIEDLVSIFRKTLLPYLVGDKGVLLWAENLFQQAQVVLQEKKTIIWAYDEIDSKQINFILQEISRELITRFNMENILNVLAVNLSRLQIPNCFIYLFMNVYTQDQLFEYCLPVLEYSNETRTISPARQFGPAKQNLSKVTSSFHRAFAMNALLLHVGDMYIGFALMEPGPLDERVYQVLNLNISVAMLGVMLLNKMDKNYKIFIEQSHREGMAEIANGILQDIRNILHSLQISILQLQDLINTSPMEELFKINTRVEEKLSELKTLINDTPQGRSIPESYFQLETPLKELQDELVEHINRLEDKNMLINDMVTAQQKYTGIQMTLETIDMIPIIEDVLKMNQVSLEQHHIEVIKNYREIPKILAQKTKLFYILMNLIKNAIEAMNTIPQTRRKLTITIEQINLHQYIRITDTGKGIPKGMLESIFTYGLESKKQGHGFGLHSCANYMTEMKGKMWAESKGAGQGAAFVLEFSQ